LPIGNFVAWPYGRELPQVEAETVFGYKIRPVKLIENFVMLSGNDVYISASPDMGFELKIRRLFNKASLNIHYLSEGADLGYRFTLWFLCQK